MASLRHQLVVAVLKATQQKKALRSGANLRKAVAKDRAKASTQPSRRLSGVLVTSNQDLGFPVFTVALAAGGSGRTAMYLHGGAYVSDLQPEHWNYIGELVRRTGVTMLVPQYPLAPTHTVHDSFPAMLRLAKAQLGAAPLLVGDSAGGGLALALGAQLGGASLVLIAPWVDAVMEPAPAEDLEARDPWLSAPGLRAAALWWSQYDPGRAEVSPLRANLSEIKRAIIFAGGRDILYPQSLALAETLGRLGIPCALHTDPELVHVYPLLPIPEAKPAMAAAAAFVTAAEC